MTDFSDKVVYQIYPKSFRDTNGDGFGDIPGIIEKLDYLQELGVDYLWLTPFFPSPQRDNGYDVSDYRSVNPLFGTMEDLEALIRESRARSMELMLDMSMNGSRGRWPERKNISTIIFSGKARRTVHPPTGSPNSAAPPGNMCPA